MKPNLSILVGACYDAIGKEEAWSPLVGQLCDYFDATIGLLVVAGQGQRDQGFYAAHNHSETSARAYSDHWWQHDVWLHTGVHTGLFVKGMVGLGTDVVPAQVMRQSAFYKEFLVTMPAEFGLFCVLADGSDPQLSPPMTLSLFRPPNADNFDAGDVSALRSLYPHLHRAFELHWQMRNMRGQLDVFHASLDTMDFGVVFFDAARRIRHTNQTAKLIVARAYPAATFDGADAQKIIPGAPLRRVSNLVLHTLPASVTDLIEAAARGTGGASLLGDSGLMALAMPVSTPVRTPAGDTRASVMLLLVDPANRPEAAADFLSHAFGLSKAESRLLPLLLQGNTPAQIAQTLDLKLPTVRSQLSSIFSKTGTSRQQDLMRLLGALPPLTDTKF